jgi:kynurenine formamidase
MTRCESSANTSEPLANPQVAVRRTPRLWLGAGKIIIENLASLAELPDRCRIVVAPLKVRHANGGLARVFALLDD